jgi:hypothetical protein
MRLLALTALLITGHALACPNLAGYFSICRSTTGNTAGARELTVRQRLQGAVTLYQLSGIDEESGERHDQSVLADGRTYITTQIDSATGQTLAIRTWAICRQNTLVINQHVSRLPFNTPLSQLQTTMSKTGTQLELAISGTAGGLQINDRVECD